MSDPMQPSDRTQPPPPPPDEATPKGNGPGALMWILLLIAILALAWYFLGRRDTVQPPPDVATPIGETTPVPSESPVSTAPARREAAPERTRPAARANRDARAVNQPAPSYPAAALRAREEGTVLVQVDVDAGGNATRVELAQRSRSRELDRAALQAVRGWTFEPAIRDGKPVASTVQVPVDFRLETQ